MRTRNRLLTLSMFCLITIAAGCGSNDHVTAPGSSGGATSLAAEDPNIQAVETGDPELVTPEEIVMPPEEVPVEVVASPAPTAEPISGVAKNGENGKDGKPGEDGKNAEGEKVVIIEKTIEKIIIEKGSDGVNGLDGCADQNRVVEGFVKGISSEELAEIRKLNGENLPYYLKPKKGVSPKLDLLTIGGTNKTMGYQRYVNDAQVIFDLELILPARKYIKTSAPMKLNLTFDMYKKSVDQYHETELICLLEIGLCSGHEFTSKNWTQMINPSFGNGKPFINDYFSRELKSGIEAAGTRSGKEFSSSLSVDFAKLFAPAGKELSQEAVLDILYGEEKSMDKSITRTLRFVVADDVMITGGSRTSARLNYVHDGCTEAKDLKNK